MTLIVEDGSIVTGADSYVTVAEATDFIENYLEGEYDIASAAFLALSSAQKETTVRRAAYDLNRKYRQHWKGYKVSYAQSMDWPRANVVDEDNYNVPSSSIPTVLKRAQIEFARKIASGIDVFSDQPRGGRTKSERVDVIAVEYFPNAPSGMVFEDVDYLLSGLLKMENKVIRS